jgi:hypothetical protein
VPVPVPDPPEVDPVVVTPPNPKPDPEPEVKPKPEPEPKFDVSDFLDNRARKIMRERAAPLIAARDAERARNLTSLERELGNEARKEARSILRDEYAASIKSYGQDCRDNGNLITEAPPEALWPMAGAVRLHSDFLRKQQTIDQKLVRELASLADTYVKGIEKQIERLRQDDDPAAVKLLEKEIDSVHEKENYFPSLMLGN